MAVYLGSTKNGDEYLITPMSRTLCRVAFILKFVILSNVSPKLTTIQFGSGLIDLNSPSILTYKPGNPKVVSKVINPESQCSGVVNLKSSEDN